MELPLELQQDIDRVVQYMIYNMRAQTDIELRESGRDPAPYLDNTLGYKIEIGVEATDRGWQVIGVYIVGVVDGTSVDFPDSSELEDLDSNDWGD